MTTAQSKALKTIEAMKFKMEKTNRWDIAKTDEKCKEQPTMAIILQEQLEYRMQQRQEQLQVFLDLLAEAVKRSDYGTGLYQGFKHNCIAKDLLNPTDAEYEEMSVDQVMIIGYARNWRGYFPKMSVAEAITEAIIYGCPHANALEYIRINRPEEQQAA